jgi:hypothetical protein
MLRSSLRIFRGVPRRDGRPYKAAWSRWPGARTPGFSDRSARDHHGVGDGYRWLRFAFDSPLYGVRRESATQGDESFVHISSLMERPNSARVLIINGAATTCHGFAVQETTLPGRRHIVGVPARGCWTSIRLTTPIRKFRAPNTMHARGSASLDRRVLQGDPRRDRRRARAQCRCSSALSRAAGRS